MELRMGYFITGATGFIGRHLVVELAARGEPIWILVRPESRDKFDRLASDCGPAGKLLVQVEGDLAKPLLGISEPERRAMRGRIKHFFHLGALYDLSATDADLARANVLGTRNAIDFAHDIEAGCFHFVSSIAAAGRFRGTFTERMFGEAEGLDLPYFRTKHESEGLVRTTCKVPWRIYRPGMVVGHSRSGVIDKIDGPYYLFKLIQRVRDCLPRWVPLVGIEGGHINLVPVDFVAAAMVHLAHAPEQDGECFHLTDPKDRRVGDVLNVFARAAHAPTMMLRFDAGAANSPPNIARPLSALLPSVKRIAGQLFDDLGIPRSIVGLLDHPTKFDSAKAQALLAPAGIRVPALDSYAWRLWDYWERCLDPDLHTAARLRQMVSGKTALVTGGSAGIGRATALRLAEAGARLIIVARDEEKLARVRAEIAARGAEVATYSCDIGEPQACDDLIKRLLAEHGRVDILINNAGRSIRRAIDNSYERLHDYERLMRLNYFSAVRMTLGLLPAMVRHGAGHVINISSISVLTNEPHFAAYNASKAALEAFSRCAAAEYAARGIRFTVVNMPLVRTAMVAPTKMYEHFELMQPEQAAEGVCAAIIERPERLATPLGTVAQLVELFAPEIGRAVRSESYRMFPDSEAAGGPGAQASRDAGAFVSLTRGIHW
jgi:NAD(P)-dependent dehydrogenase (short-subunit alcohol dehydrogenase family)